jgi:hypothetical protein
MESTMRHPKGIDLSVKEFSIKRFCGKSLNTLKDMPQWEVLGGQCSKCGHVGWLDKHAVLARVGNHYLLNLRQKLRCIPCDYKGMNDVPIGELDRNV